jgi:3'-phosphoadenosine 5'-phosphosulfate sulfotransferase (PAPS reductase)/FAD synthetase
MGRSHHPREDQLTLFGQDPHAIIQSAWDQHGTHIIRRTALLSGGNDSSTLAHWLAWHGYIDELLFLDTGTGIKETRQFVRQLADHLELPLQEWRAAPGTYERMITTISGGFPGPAAHSIAYQRLKERPLNAYVAHRKQGHHWRSKVLLCSGIRRAESAKRMKIANKAVDPDGVKLWVAPFIDWTMADLGLWREAHDIPSNPVAHLLHYSGECLCGANATEGELTFIASFYPEATAEIFRLQRLADRLGIARSRWGEHWREPKGETGHACGDCQMRIAALADCPVKKPASRPEVVVHGYGQREPVTITLRVHSPGREPGPEAFEVHSIPFMEIDQYGVHLAQATIGRFAEGDGGKLKLAAPNGVPSPARNLLEQHHGNEQTAIDLTCQCDCKRVRGRLPDACVHKPGLAVWMLTEPLEQQHQPFLTLGPIRLTNTTGRRVFDRIRVIDRILLLQDDPCGRLCLNGDAPARMLSDSGFWQVHGVGACRGILIGRERDATAIEQVWRSKGIEPGYRLPSADPDYYEAVTVAPKYPGDPQQPRLLNALPADLWTPEDPTPERTPPALPRPTMQTCSPLRERHERALAA